MKIQLRDILTKVNENANVSREKMMKQYNRNIVFYDYKPDDQVWLKCKHFKPGESRKLSPRKTGPWVIKRKMPNRVNFEITNQKETRIVHHNRLSPVRNATVKTRKSPSPTVTKPATRAVITTYDGSSD